MSKHWPYRKDRISADEINERYSDEAKKFKKINEDIMTNINSEDPSKWTLEKILNEESIRFGTKVSIKTRRMQERKNGFFVTKYDDRVNIQLEGEGSPRSFYVADIDGEIDFMTEGGSMIYPPKDRVKEEVCEFYSLDDIALVVLARTDIQDTPKNSEWKILSGGRRYLRYKDTKEIIKEIKDIDELKEDAGPR